MQICSPALLYLIIGVLAIGGMIFEKISINVVLLKSLFIIIWTWFLDFLCKKGHSTVSWILVLLPYIIFLIMALFVYEHVNKKIENLKQRKD